MENIGSFEAQKGVLQGEQPIPLEPIRHCLYSRKSTEQDELQALSIEPQKHQPWGWCFCGSVARSQTEPLRWI